MRHARSEVLRDSAAINRWMDTAGRVPLLTAAEELHLGAAVQAWQQHEGGPAAAPLAIQRRGRKARDRMVAANLRLVGHVVLRSRTRLPFDDACQSASIGLQRAAEKFDPARGYKFSTYAYWWIRQAVSRADEDMGSVIRSPNHIQQKLVRLNRLSADLSQRLGRAPSTAELAEASGLEPALMVDLLARGRDCISLDVQVTDSGCRLGDMVADPSGDDALDRLEEMLGLERLQEGLKALALADPAGVELLRDLFGLSGQPPLSLAEAGRRRRRTREAMRQARDRLLRRLRWILRPDGSPEEAEQGRLDL